MKNPISQPNRLRRAALAALVVAGFMAAPMALAQSTTAQGNAGQSNTGQSNTGQNNTGQNNTGQNNTVTDFNLIPLTCLLVPARISNVGSDRGGIVKDVPVARADFVKKDQILVQLDDALARSDLQLALITQSALGAKIDRSAALVSQNMIARDEVETMRTEYAVASAHVERARIQLSRAQVLAPFAGYIAKVDVEQGELIGATPIIQLIDMSQLKAELVFAADAFGSLAIGDELHVAVDLVAKSVTAQIVAIDPFLDAASNTFSVIAQMDNLDLALPAGASCAIVSVKN